MTAIGYIGNSHGTSISEQEVLLPHSASSEGSFRQQVVNVASVKHRSPFRYPGGKTWLVPLTRRWLASFQQPMPNFVEPFAGGGIVGLSALFDANVETLTLVETDSNVGSVWQTIVNGDGPELAKRIVDFDVTEENVRNLLAASLAFDDILGRALTTIVRNRVQRGGIMAQGAGLVRNGENGRGLKSRWYPETLRNRLLDLHFYSQNSKIAFQSGDGIKFIRENRKDKRIGWFIDPPYTIAGRRLYTHSDVDHELLFEETGRLAGPFLMTYDDTEHIRKLVKKQNFQFVKIPMKSTHHIVKNELLISRNLDWFSAG